MVLAIFRNHNLVLFMDFRAETFYASSHRVGNSMFHIFYFDSPHIKGSIHSIKVVQICAIISRTESLLHKIFDKVIEYQFFRKFLISQ